jgi:hypothetical protein
MTPDPSAGPGVFRLLMNKVATGSEALNCLGFVRIVILGAWISDHCWMKEGVTQRSFACATRIQGSRRARVVCASASEAFGIFRCLSPPSAIGRRPSDGLRVSI